MQKVRLGIIGVSGRGGLAEHWHNPGGSSEVVAGADINPVFLDEFKKKTGENTFITTDYKKLLERGDVDAVAITSPDFTHEEYAVEAFLAGKHVFSEKPMAITTEGCDRMMREWRKSGKKFMVGHNMRYMRIFRAMKDIADSGVIGEIKAAWVRHFVGAGGNFYYHDWHARSDKSSGLLLHKGSHDIDMIHWITGSYTKKVSAFGGLDFFGGDKPDSLLCFKCPDAQTCPEAQPEAPERRQFCAFRKEVDVEDNNLVIMELENGVKASYLQCHFSPDYFRNYVFIGTEGRMENLNDYSKIEVKTRNQTKKWKNYSDRIHEVKPAEGGHGGADPVICKDFIDMIVKNTEPLATPEAGRMSVAAGYAATISIRNGGQTIQIPPINKENKK